LELASYRRRLEREKASAELRSLTKEEISSKRVTGLMYNMANSIKVAGPFAALYILRRSPTYRSHDFQSLPLLSAIKWYFSEKVNDQDDSIIEVAVELVKNIFFP